MNNRALIGLSAAAMSALVATAVGCGEPQQKTYTPAEEPAATVEATTEADTTESTETEAATEEKAETTEAATEEKTESTEAEETTEAADADKADTAAAGTYTDGEYTATGKGIGGDVPVTVTITDGKISDVTVGDNSETQGIGSKAIEQLPALIVEANGTDGVDAVSGASVTSKAIFTAVNDCLEQAGAGEAAETEAAADDKAADSSEAAESDTAEAGSYADGEYTAEGKGIGGKVPVTVTIKDGKISDVTVGDNSETQGIGSKAIEQLPALIVEANGTDGVDAVSGASVTSKAIFTAVNDCLEQASAGDAAEETAEATDEKAEEAAQSDEAAEAEAADEKAEEAADTAEAGAYADGEYTAEGKGIGGKVPVTVTIKDGKISDVTVGDNSETQGIGSKAIEQLPAAIVEANGTEGVDAVSGASVTSKAIFTAVNDCLEQASAGDATEAAAEETTEAAEAEATDEKAEETTEAASDEAADTAEAGAYADGEYTAEGKGIGGKVPVTVTIKDGKISDVTVGDNSETQGIGSKAIEQLPAAIVEANGTEGVDAVSGASVTSKAIFTAVNDCLEQASAGESTEDAADEKADDKAEATDAKADEKADTKDEAKADEKAEEATAGYTDGEYTAEGKGIGGKVPVTVTIKDGKISDVTVGDNSETQGIGSKAIEQLPAAIVEANGTEGVDAVSGASVTSKAIFTAVNDCLEQASAGDAAADTAEAGSYADGEYTAEGKGIGGKVPVTVTIKDGKISDVTVGDNSETQGIGSKAIEQLPAAIVEANGTEGVDAVSGASVTSKAIFTAVNDCLEQASAGDAAADTKADSKDAKAASTDTKDAKADTKASK